MELLCLYDHLPITHQFWDITIDSYNLMIWHRDPWIFYHHKVREGLSGPPPIAYTCRVKSLKILLEWNTTLKSSIFLRRVVFHLKIGLTIDPSLAFQEIWSFCVRTHYLGLWVQTTEDGLNMSRRFQFVQDQTGKFLHMCREDRR